MNTTVHQQHFYKPATQTTALIGSGTVLNSDSKSSTADPKETFVSSHAVSASSEVSGRESAGNIRVSRFDGLKSSLASVGTIFSGMAGMAGWTEPVTKRLALEGPEAREPIAPSLLAVLDQPLSPGPEVCAKEDAAYRALNESLSGKYPTLERAMADPDAFKEDLRGRFEAQKELTPEDPYTFDFSDYGVPVLQQIGVAVAKEIKELQVDIKDLDGRSFSRKKIEDRQVGLQFLGELQDEISQRVESGDLSYRRTQELGYFSALALGYFDQGDINLRDRMLLKIDSYLQGEDKVSIQEEYRRYKDNEFTVHQKSSPAFRTVEKPFADAFFNPEEMELVSLPTMEPLSQTPFTRLMNKDIFLSGIAADPLSADGFVRAGRLFWLHDVRHNSAIFSKKQRYQEERQLTPAQSEKLDRRIDVWNVELTTEMDKLENPQFLAAVDTLVFNLHHDRGLPLVPSTYDENCLDYVPKGLRLMWGLSGQDERFDKPGPTMKAAYQWLEGFWNERRGQETEIVGI